MGWGKERGNPPHSPSPSRDGKGLVQNNERLPHLLYHFICVLGYWSCLLMYSGWNTRYGINLPIRGPKAGQRPYLAPISCKCQSWELPMANKICTKVIIFTTITPTHTHTHTHDQRGDGMTTMMSYSLMYMYK